MSIIKRVLSFAFLIFLLRLIIKGFLILVKAFWFVFYWLCWYPLFIAFYIGLYPLIWLYKRVF
ncbi:hypothetical protein EO92_01310 [Methanosarcina sp. 2.H.A.1B.4]|nr:hypothetical protein EO92_01310 [Methanosarcina sp. 2.H.A.1B.4]